MPLPEKTTAGFLPLPPGARRTSVRTTSAGAVHETEIPRAVRRALTTGRAGFVWSYRSSTCTGSLRCPTASRHWPTILAGFPSGPEYVTGGLHSVTPEPASWPLKATLTGWLYHPSASGGRSSWGVTVG